MKKTYDSLDVCGLKCSSASGTFLSVLVPVPRRCGAAHDVVCAVLGGKYIA